MADHATVAEGIDNRDAGQVDSRAAVIDTLGADAGQSLDAFLETGNDLDAHGSRDG